MAMMIDTDCVSEIRIDGQWYKIEPGSFAIDNLYFQENESRGENRYMNGRMFFDHIEPPKEALAELDKLEVMGYHAKEKGKDTTLWGPLSNIQDFRTIPRAKLPADIKERRKRENWRNPDFQD